MIEKIKLFMLFVILFFSFIFNSYAYTKEDIINLASSINVCSSESISLVKGMKTTYVRLLNERDVSEADLNKIYNNINYVKGILESNNVCSKDELSKLPTNIKDDLYNIYKQTNNLITSSPMYIESDNNINNKPNQHEEVKVVVDSSTKEIKVYEGGTLIDVVGDNVKLNYVGINKSVLILIILLTLILLIMVVLKILKKKSIFITSTIYAMIIMISITFVFRNEISIVFDVLNTMSVKTNGEEKTIVVKNNSIVSYPSYGSKYATIYINNKESDVYFGDSIEILAKGVGHSTQTSLPGEEGKTVISGHNTGVFNELFNLNKNDKIIIETVYGKFTYKLIGSKVVDDTDISSLNEECALILYTCYPNSSLYGNKRLVMYFNAVNSEWLGDNNEE